ncbi:hypothetical protein FHS43_000428 [Streptosporangium becharense]|uniref:Uncharacterized protein n=1 Tax=Streptosporangium becharense TaxID=1816182 RepID=A0A7W9IFJ8_9ACTN|nr:hypothetical protein [Streptosporangium becharense]MBB2909182.1 hypothetical protein [Streptosporangium becharense]MBB5819799.1 hypothetical protein [Streptosporangium becharense]
MSPDLHLAMIAYQSDRLREEAARHRLTRQVQEAEKKEGPAGKRRRSLFGRILPA